MLVEIYRGIVTDSHVDQLLVGASCVYCYLFYEGGVECRILFSGANETIKAAVNELGFFQCLAQLPSALICEIIMLIPAFMVSLHAITRKIEIVIRCGCLPLALPNLFSEGTRSGGMRYLKKLLALELHGWMMMAIIYVAWSLAGSVVLESLAIKDIISTALYAFAAVGLISAGKQIVNDVFGVCLANYSLVPTKKEVLSC